MRRWTPLLALLVGCRVMDVVGAGGSGGGTGSATVETVTAGSGAGTATAGSGSETATAGSGAGTAGEACVAVDVLFVVETALGTDGLRTALALKVPDFVQQLAQAMPSTSFHFAITTTEFGPPPDVCSESFSNCKLQQTPEEIAARYIRPDLMMTTVPGGQGRLFEYQGATVAVLDPGGSVLDASDWLAGAIGALPKGCPLAMMAAAVGWSMHPIHAATNAGFLRDGASLAVIVLSDGLDATPEDLAFLEDTLRAAKAECATCVQFAGAFDACVVSEGDPIWIMMNDLDDDPVFADVDGMGFVDALLGPALVARVAASCAG